MNEAGRLRLLHDDVAPVAQGVVVGAAEHELDRLLMKPRWPSEGGIDREGARAGEVRDLAAAARCVTSCCFIVRWSQGTRRTMTCPALTGEGRAKPGATWLRIDATMPRS